MDTATMVMAVIGNVCIVLVTILSFILKSPSRRGSLLVMGGIVLLSAVLIVMDLVSPEVPTVKVVFNSVTMVVGGVFLANEASKRKKQALAA